MLHWLIWRIESWVFQPYFRLSHADPPRTSRSLPRRLAPGVSLDPLRSRQGPLRRLRPAARQGRPVRRRRPMVRPSGERLARRAWRLTWLGPTSPIGCGGPWCVLPRATSTTTPPTAMPRTWPPGVSGAIWLHDQARAPATRRHHGAAAPGNGRPVSRTLSGVSSRPSAPSPIPRCVQFRVLHVRRVRIADVRIRTHYASPARTRRTHPFR